MTLCYAKCCWCDVHWMTFSCTNAVGVYVLLSSYMVKLTAFICILISYHVYRYRVKTPLCKNIRWMTFSCTKCCVSKHTGEKSHHCTHCGKAFSQANDLKRYMMSHTGEKPFICSQWHKAFSRNSDQPILFKCSQCHKAFPKKSYLKSHLTLHIEEKTYQCKYCGKGFSWIRNFERHVKILGK